MDHITEIIENLKDISIEVYTDATLGKRIRGESLLPIRNSNHLGKTGVVLSETWNSDSESFQKQEWFFLESENNKWNIHRVMFVVFENSFEEETDFGLIPELSSFESEGELKETFKRVFEFFIEEKIAQANREKEN